MITWIVDDFEYRRKKKTLSLGTCSSCGKEGILISRECGPCFEERFPTLREIENESGLEHTMQTTKRCAECGGLPGISCLCDPDTERKERHKTEYQAAVEAAQHLPGHPIPTHLKQRPYGAVCIWHCLRCQWPMEQVLPVTMACFRYCPACSLRYRVDAERITVTLSPPDTRLPPLTTVVHVRDAGGYDVYIGRKCRDFPQGSRWGNPYKIGPDGDRANVIALYRGYLGTQPDLIIRLRDLKGKRLGCWCKPEACHGDVLAEMADAL